MHLPPSTGHLEHCTQHSMNLCFIGTGLTPPPPSPPPMLWVHWKWKLLLQQSNTLLLVCVCFSSPPSVFSLWLGTCPGTVRAAEDGLRPPSPSLLGKANLTPGTAVCRSTPSPPPLTSRPRVTPSHRRCRLPPTNTLSEIATASHPSPHRFLL